MAFLLALLSIAMFLAAGLDYVENRRLENLRRKAALSSESKIKTYLVERGWTHVYGPVMVMGKNQRTAEIDAVVLMENGVAVVLESKYWSGIIHGARSEQEWRSIKSDGSITRHRNPIFQAERQARILKEVSGITCVSLVVMLGKGRPGEGYWPPGVLSLQDVEDSMLSLAAKTKNKKGLTREEGHQRMLDIGDDMRSKAIHAQKVDSMQEKKWLSWLAIAVVLSAAAIFMEKDTAGQFIIMLGR